MQRNTLNWSYIVRLLGEVPLTKPKSIKEESSYHYKTSKGKRMNSHLGWPHNKRGMNMVKSDKRRKRIKRLLFGGKIEEALALAENTDTDFLLQMGALMIDKDEYEIAERLFSRVIEYKPDKGAVWVCKGLALQCLRKYEEAIRCYDESLARNCENDEVWVSKGESLQELGKNREAIICYDKALEIDPLNSEIWFLKAEAMQDSGDFTGALFCYDKILEIDPQNIDAWYNKGTTYAHLGRSGKAITCLKETVKRDPHHVNAWFNQGTILENLGKYERALPVMQKFCRQHLGMCKHCWARGGF